MGQQVIVTLTDDLDGSEADETIMFALDGASYEIDLNAKNAAGLREALDKYVTAARKPSRPTGGRRGRSSSRRAGNTDVDPRTVRAWATEQGIEISSHGRIPAEIIDRYRTGGGV